MANACAEMHSCSCVSYIRVRCGAMDGHEGDEEENAQPIKLEIDNYGWYVPT